MDLGLRLEIVAKVPKADEDVDRPDGLVRAARMLQLPTRQLATGEVPFEALLLFSDGVPGHGRGAQK